MARPARHKEESRDDNTERPLIALIEKLVTDLTRKVTDALAAFETKQNERHQAMATALETLTESVTKNTVGQTELTTAVNAAIVELNADTPTDAQLLTLSAAIDANTANAATLATALNNAVTPPGPEPEPA